MRCRSLWTDISFLYCILALIIFILSNLLYPILTRFKGVWLKSFGAAALLLFLLAAGCETVSTYIKPALENEGEVFVYLQPFPQEADRLTIEIESIAAVRNDGAEFPLTLSFATLKGSGLKRQRFLASGRLPPGQYTGLSIKAKSAKVAVEEGEAALLVPPEPLKNEFSFEVIRKRALLLNLVYQHSRAVQADFSFRPVFTVSIPGATTVNFIGYVSNSGANTITVFDKLSGLVTGVIATDEQPMGMVLDQTLLKAYVAFEGEDEVGIIDLLSGTIANRIPLNGGDRPVELALTPDRKFLLTVNTGTQTVSFISTDSLTETARATVGQGPHSIIINRTGSRAYVFNSRSNTISVINLAAYLSGRPVTAQAVQTVSTEAGPIFGQFSARGDKLYVVHERSPYINVRDPASNALLNRVYMGTGGRTIKVDSKTNLFYVAPAGGRDLDVYDPFSFVAGDFIPVEGEAVSMTIDNDDNTLCVVVPEKRVVKIINLTSRKVIAELDVDTDPYWVTVMGER